MTCRNSRPNVSGSGASRANSNLKATRFGAERYSGSGLYAADGAKIQSSNATIAGNALSRVHLQENPLRGGGVLTTDTTVVAAQNTLIADNYYTDRLIKRRIQVAWNSLTQSGSFWPINLPLVQETR